MDFIVCICSILLGCLLELLIMILVLKYERYIKDLEKDNAELSNVINMLNKRIELMKK